MYSVAPEPFLGGAITEYAVEQLSNGGLGTRHLPTRKVVPHVLAGVEQAAAVPSSQGVPGLGGRVSGFLTKLSPWVGVLNLGAGLFAGYQPWHGADAAALPDGLYL